MEGLRVRAILVGVLLIVVGIAIQMAPTTSLTTRDEAFMEKNAPMKVGEYAFFTDAWSKKPAQSGAVSEETYTTLNPFGIVWRIYSMGSDGYDVLLVSSNRKESFHDQRVCFSAGGWTLSDQSQETLETSRGPVPVTFVNMTHELKGKRIAALLYKGPSDRGLLPTLSRIVMLGGAAALLIGLAWLVVPAFFGRSRSRTSGIVFFVLGAVALLLSMTAMTGGTKLGASGESSHGFYATPSSLTFAMLKEQLAGGENLDSTFYRFIPVENSSKQELAEFIKSYLEEARKVSGGYF